MLPAGYLFKKVAARPDWDAIPRHVTAIYSISDCMSENFADYVSLWRHNGFWLFDSPAIMREIAASEGIDLSGHTLFYYEMFEHELDETLNAWSRFSFADFPVNVAQPEKKQLEGFDVATYSQHNIPECSPLACNGISAEVCVNAHCLFATFEEARSALESGKFDKSEPGPFRIVAVYTVPALPSKMEWDATPDEARDQIETGQHLQRELDQSRLSDRKLFPDHLRGVTW
jgi:hypothetical protein